MITEAIRRIPLLSFIFIAIFLPGCGGDEKPRATDTATSGRINISVDESFSLLFDTQIYTFESIYPKADINAAYKPEGDVIHDIYSDSVKVIVISREFTDDEKKALTSRRINPSTVKIAEDAVALLVNRDNPDTLLTVDRLRNILAGKDTLWTQINPNSSLSNITVVFDNNNSANARYLQEKLMNGAGFNRNCFAVKSNKQVIDYVSSNRNALGVISVNWISDRDDTLSTGFLQRIKVVSVAKADGEEHFKPYQAYIKTKEYPFCRDVYMMYRGRTGGLGTGFASFVAGDKGQRIILKAGLVPAIAPVRIVEINNQ